jgi:hypothetical protein
MKTQKTITKTTKRVLNTIELSTIRGGTEPIVISPTPR